VSEWIQLLAPKWVGRKRHEKGEWIKVGNQIAEKWIAEGAARYGRLAQVQSTPAQLRTSRMMGMPSVPLFGTKTRKLVERAKSASIHAGLKVAFGMIVFNGDHILSGILESVYPWASQICIAEGPTKFHADRLKVSTSTDKTVEIIRNFPDPEEKISLVQGAWPNKLAMCNAWIKSVRPDTDYVWQIDSDEMYKQENIQQVLSLLGPEGYDSVAFRFRSFYGGFERHMIGWEEAQETHRIQRFYPGAVWASHRPPTINAPDGKPWRTKNHLTHWEIDAAVGIRIFHYSFVFPSQVKMKYLYYNDLTKGNMISDGYKSIYLPWTRGDDQKKAEIERKFKGVHHLTRGPGGQCVCHTVKYYGKHPQWIEQHRQELEVRIKDELRAANGN